MKIEVIKQLIEEFESADVHKMKIQTEDLKLELEKGQSSIPRAVPNVAPVNMETYDHQVSIVTPTAAPTNETAVTSPIVGVFYRASSPNQKPFVEVGDTVSKGQVICIVEAMKVMNEIKAPIDGVVSKIMADNNDLVEFDEILMMIEG